MCNVICLITCLLSVYFLSDTLTRSPKLCQVLVRHFVTLTEDSAAPGSKSSRIVVQRLEEIFCDMEEIMVSCVIECTQEQDFFSSTTKWKLSII